MTVQIYLGRGAPQQVIVVINVSERAPLTTALAAGALWHYSTQEGPGRPAYPQTLAARVTDHDVWGTGKTLDLALIGGVSVRGGTGQEYAARLQYTDPRLLDSTDFLLNAGACYTHANLNLFPGGLQVGATYQNGGAEIDFAIGRHLGTKNFSHGSDRD